MPHKDTSKILFVINAFAGNNADTPWQETIGEYFAQKNILVDYYLLPHPPDSTALKQYIFKNLPQKVVAVGGDGTITLLANLLLDTEIALGILPGGSANGMARELGISENTQEALAVIENGVVQNCDTIKINNKNTCLHLSDIGLNARLIKYFSEGKIRGKLGYAILFLKTLWNREKMQVRIQADGLDIKREAYMVVLANARMYGTGLLINPNGRLNDGLFEIVILRQLSVFSLLKMLIRPTALDPQEIEIFAVTQVEMNTSKKVHFQIDGEYMAKTKRVTAQMMPASLRLILPKQNRAHLAGNTHNGIILKKDVGFLALSNLS